jgi:hypothetical protein
LRSRKIPAYVWIAFVFVFLISAYSIRKRVEVESENRSVAIAVEYETIEAMAAGQNVPVVREFQDSKVQGLRAVVLSEESIGELISTGRIYLMATTSKNSSATGLYLQFKDLSAEPRVQRGLSIRFGSKADPQNLNGEVLKLPSFTAFQIRSTPIGLNPIQVAVARRAGLEIIARFGNTLGESAESISKTLQWAKEDGAEIFLPIGDEVLGFRTAIDQTLQDLRADGLYYASPEFAKIAGDTEMVEKGKDIVVRLHSAQVAELDKLTPFDVQDRYVKAARERDMRILLLRPLSTAGVRPYTDFNDYMLGISTQLIKNGQQLGKPHPSREPNLPTIIFPLLGAALSPIIWFVGCGFFQDTRVRNIGAALLLILTVACLTKLGREGMALLGSMAFPLLGFFTLDQVLSKLGRSEFRRIFVGFWVVSGISVMGGVCVAGMLNSLAFYIHASEFQAVKLSVFFPIVVVGIHYFIKLTDWKRAMRSPMTWGSTALGLALGLVLAIMIARTGNDTGVGPSGGELVFRSLLDKFLYVRPRTKEFLVGHPVLILGIGMLGRVLSRSNSDVEKVENDSMPGWTVLALMVGAIGQTSMVNTLCHIHIPFFLSLARDVEGMILGCIIGLALWIVTKRWLPYGD